VVECTGLENRRPFTGLVSSNLTLSAICAIKMGPVFGSYFDCAEQGSWTNSPEFDQIAERFGTPERFGDGARRARARMARVNLTLSAICAIKMGPVRGSDQPLG
jgi:hypothetical protein